MISENEIPEGAQNNENVDEDVGFVFAESSESSDDEENIDVNCKVTTDEKRKMAKAKRISRFAHTNGCDDDKVDIDKV